MFLLQRVFFKKTHITAIVTLQNVSMEILIQNGVQIQLCVGELDFDAGQPLVFDFFGVSGFYYGSDLKQIVLTGDSNPDFSTQTVINEISKAEIENGQLMIHLDSTTPYRYFRFAVEYNSLPVNDSELSDLLIGRSFDLPNGVSAPYTPPKLSAKTEILNNRTMGGNFVGRSVLSGQYDFIIKNKNITPEWIEENWLNLHKQISEKPFMYLWDDTRPQDAVFCWTKGDIPPPKYDNQCYFSFSIPCNGFIEND